MDHNTLGIQSVSAYKNNPPGICRIRNSKEEEKGGIK
jgi:hypothetical protein